MAGAQGWLHPFVAPAAIPPSSLAHMGWLARGWRRSSDHGEVQAVPGPPMPVSVPQTS